MILLVEGYQRVGACIIRTKSSNRVILYTDTQELLDANPVGPYIRLTELLTGKDVNLTKIELKELIENGTIL